MSAAEDQAKDVLPSLRALASLLEGGETGDSFHDVAVNFFPDTAQQAQAIMAALPLHWKADQPKGDWQHINGTAYRFHVTIFAKADDISEQTGVVEVPLRKMRPEIAALLSEPMRDQA